MDRELNAASGKRVRGQEAIFHTRLLTLLTHAELYCGLSAIWENDRLGPESRLNFELLLAEGELITISHDFTLDEFKASRREAYEHDQDRYPNYFTAAGDSLSWAGPTRRKEAGSTQPLVGHLTNWAGGLPSGPGKVVLTIARLREPLRNALLRREGQAVTYAYFQPFLDDVANKTFAESTVRREISRGFTLDYIHSRNGDIATGIRGLHYYDSLSTNFPQFDMVVLSEIAAICGLSQLLNPELTNVDEWRRYLVERHSPQIALLAGTVSWIVAALDQREHSRSPGPGDSTDVYYDQDSIRGRIVSTLRRASQVSDRLMAPSPGASPVESAVAAQLHLLWVADRLGKLDAKTAGLLQATRGVIAMTTVDVVVATVTDVEERAVRFALEECGAKARVNFGAKNTYWVYGPIAGTVVAVARSAMGSGGQGGSMLTIEDAIRELTPAAVVSLGIAFGVDESKQPIGQLLISAILTSYELQKVGVGPSGKVRMTSRGPRAEASPRLIGRFRDTRLADIGINIKIGEILSGEKLIDNPEFKTALLKRFPEAIGGEMEGAGIQAACGRRNVEWVVAKAVCDYAESKGTDKEDRQGLAAATAARAFTHVLRTGGLARGH